MKQLHFKTSNGEFLLVEDYGNFPRDFPYDFWELFEKLEQLTEEQAKEVVDESMQSGLYAHYVKGVNPPNIYGYRRSINSIHTLLESLGVLFENPYPDMGFRYSREQKLYRIYEDKVWNKSNTYLFKKI